MSTEIKHWLSEPGQKGFRISAAEIDRIKQFFGEENPATVREAFFRLLDQAENGASAPLERLTELENVILAQGEVINELENKLRDETKAKEYAQSEYQRMESEQKIIKQMIENVKKQTTLAPNQAIIEFTPEEKQIAARAAATLRKLGHQFSTDEPQRLDPAEVLHTATAYFNHYVEQMKSQLETFKPLL